MGAPSQTSKEKAVLCTQKKEGGEITQFHGTCINILYYILLMCNFGSKEILQGNSAVGKILRTYKTINSG